MCPVSLANSRTGRRRFALLSFVLLDHCKSSDIRLGYFSKISFEFPMLQSVVIEALSLSTQYAALQFTSLLYLLMDL